MKKFGFLLGMLLWLSTTFGMKEEGLKGTLDTLVGNLQALEKVLLPKPIPAPTPKEKDPLKKFLASYLAGLTPGKRAEFEALTDEEKAARLAQAFGLSPAPTPLPDEPKPVVPTPPVTPPLMQEPGETEVPVPPAPPFGAPPPPPAPGVKTPEKKPAGEKPVKKLLPILSPQELAGKSAEEKQRSDALFLQALMELSFIEFEKLSDMEATIRQMLQSLRNENSFLKRAELDQVLSKDGLVALLKKDFHVAVEEDAKKTRLDELYAVFVGMKKEQLHEKLLGAIIFALSACLFEASELPKESIEFLVVSYITAQRGPAKSKSEVGYEERINSDTVYVEAWKKLTQVEDGIAVVVRHLNVVRMHPDFLLFQNMLWRGLEGSDSRRAQVQEPLKGTLPLLLILKSPQEFRVAHGVIETTIKNHAFNVETFEKSIDKQLVKNAIDWQRAFAKPKVLILLPDFVLGHLKKVKTLAGLKGVLANALDKYPEETAGIKEHIQQAIAQLEPTSPTIQVATILGALGMLVKQEIPEDIRRNIEALITAALQDRAFVVAVHEALKNPKNFKELLLAKTKNMAFHDQLKATLDELYRTPSDVYDLLVAQLKDKNALQDVRNAIINALPDYGLLLRVFRYFVLQYKRNPEDIDALKKNIKMLMNSIAALNNPQQLATGGAAYEAIEAIKGKVRADMGGNKAMLNLPYAPEFFNIIIDDQFKGQEKAGYFTDQLVKFNPYKGKNLSELQPKFIVEEKNPQKVVDFLTALVSKSNGITVESPEFIHLMEEVRQALQGTYDKGIKPEFIE